MIKRPHVIVFAAAVLLLASAAMAAPRLELRETEFDFGYTPQNSEVSHIFWLKSTGDDSLIITQVVPGCGCTKAPLEKNALAVGDSTRLEIIFSTQRYRNHVSKSPRIETNDGSPAKNVHITTYVIERPDSTYPLIMTPYKLDLSQYGEKTRDNMSFTIKNVSPQDLDLTLIATNNDYFELELPDKVAAGETVQGMITLKKDVLDKEFAKSFTFEVNDEPTSRFTLPVKRSVPNQGSPKVSSK